jgi:hypothetical protein
MQPGQKFTKIWRLGNVGTCTWTRQYRAAWFFGPKLGDTLNISMPGNVAPGQTVDLAVDMSAPLTPDTYQSNWKLVNAAGESFGIGPNGDLPFWVRIVVVPEATATITPSFSPSLTLTGTVPPTITPTPTSTPAISVAGPAILLPGDRYDLDTNQVNSASGEDMLYQTAPDNTHWLRPQGEAQLGIYGTGEPSLEVCLSASMSGAPVAVESLSEGSYLCFRTGQGLPGWLRYDGFNPADSSINVNILTWAQP